jgi:protein-S-isoprenylcysteine O-methyltransferase Ste14
MSADAWQRVVLVQAWAAYFVVHSLLASVRVKRWVAVRHPGWMRGYRLFFNVVAVVLVVPPLVLTFAWRGEPLWAWTGPWAWLANGLALAAAAGFVWSLRFYDSGEFLGLRQWRGRVRSVEDQERLHISPLHRFVRHPWYALGLVIVWTRDMDPAFLITALAITLYFVLGSRLEERKLIHYHGEAYRRYRRRVPGLLPLPWRVLSPAQAAELEGLSRAGGARTDAEADAKPV